MSERPSDPMLSPFPESTGSNVITRCLLSALFVHLVLFLVHFPHRRVNIEVPEMTKPRIIKQLNPTNIKPPPRQKSRNEKHFLEKIPVPTASAPEIIPSKDNSARDVHVSDGEPEITFTE